MNILPSLADALHMSFVMLWKILWPLILGFALSGVIQGVVSKREMGRLLPDGSPKSLAIACGLGAASSSCSYAAVALARSIFRKGAEFTAAMAFELASTNLVAELTIIMIIMLGWQFALAEFLGGPLLIAFMALLFRLLPSQSVLQSARKQVDKGIAGKMEGHAAMDMSFTEGPLLRRVFSVRGITAASHYLAAKIGLPVAALTGEPWVNLLAAESSSSIPVQPCEPVPILDVCYPTSVSAKLAIANELAKLSEQDRQFIHNLLAETLERAIVFAQQHPNGCVLLRD